VIDDWGYLNARVRALKGRLLGRAQLDEALAAGSLDELVTFLDGTPYVTAVEEALAARPGIAGVEEGLRRDFQLTVDRVLRAAGGRARRLLEAALGRWELFNLKAVLRGLHARAGVEASVAATIPFGRLDEVALEEIARQGDVRGAVDLLAQWRLPYAGPLREALPAYRDRAHFAALEAALDRAFFAAALRGLDPVRPDDAIVADCLRREIDRILVGHALRLAHRGAGGPDAAAAFIPGGRTVDLPRFERLCAARSVPALLAALPSGAFAACLAAAAGEYLGARRLPALDRALEACFLREMMRLVARDPLSPALAVGYLWRKAAEVANLRVIARGAHARIPRVDVEAMLVTAW